MSLLTLFSTWKKSVYALFMGFKLTISCIFVVSGSSIRSD
jgi:hypothetical protein